MSEQIIEIDEEGKVHLTDGGPAFPGEQGHIPDGTWNQSWEPGMSLRYYATIEFTKAWIGVLGNRSSKRGELDEFANANAFHHGRRQADALIGWIAEREERKT